MGKSQKRFMLAGLAACLAIVGFACQKPEPLGIEYFQYVNEEAVPRISVEDAKKDFEAGNAVFVDSRGDGSYNAEHLPRALNIAFGSTPDKFSQLPKGKKIVVYCS